MNKVYQKLNKVFNKAAGFVPRSLPRGIQEFEVWSDRIISTYGLPHNDSVRFSLAVMVLHLDSTSAYKADRFFGLSALKAMSNQVVSQVIQDLKTKQQAEIEAAKAEATAAQVASDVPAQN